MSTEMTGGGDDSLEHPNSIELIRRRIKKNQINDQRKITRDMIPYNKNIRLACKLIKINKNVDIIYPLRVINNIEFKQIYRPYDSWINPLKKANTKKYSVENNWEIVIKRFNSIQKKKLKRLKRNYYKHCSMEILIISFQLNRVFLNV